ncbi:MAG: hypothetical protein JSR46_03485 [Verrucomicrobia bacterium]|nr:hypothetical protein [Verrucomicrobiota bacterium]
MTIENGSGFPTHDKYDGTSVGFTLSKKIFGRNIRIESNGTVHLDTTIGKKVRELFGKPQYADVNKAKDILKKISNESEGKFVHSEQKVVKAAVEIMVRHGEGVDKLELSGPIHEVLKPVFQKAELKFYEELVNKPDIGALTRKLWVENKTFKEAPTYSERLQMLSDYGVNLKEKTLDHEKCSQKLAKDIATQHPEIDSPRQVESLSSLIKTHLATAKKTTGLSLLVDREYVSRVADHH